MRCRVKLSQSLSCGEAQVDNNISTGGFKLNNREGEIYLIVGEETKRFVWSCGICIVAVHVHF